MVKNIFFTVTIVLCFGALNLASAQKKSKSNNSAPKSEVKFLEDIEISFAAVANEFNVKTKDYRQSLIESIPAEQKSIAKETEIEKTTALQIKYSLLLNTEVELVDNLSLFQLLDEWFGTRYRLGGESKTGIDCSAFMQVMYAGLFAIALPRTAREQNRSTRKISRTELKEGDLVFFDTRGGISHVGMYLQNNKFVHSASSGGVMISDLYDDYWSRRFVCAGRFELPAMSRVFLKP